MSSKDKQPDYCQAKQLQQQPFQGFSINAEIAKATQQKSTIPSSNHQKLPEQQQKHAAEPKEKSPIQQPATTKTSDLLQQLTERSEQSKAKESGVTNATGGILSLLNRAQRSSDKLSRPVQVEEVSTAKQQLPQSHADDHPPPAPAPAELTDGLPSKKLPNSVHKQKGAGLSVLERLAQAARDKQAQRKHSSPSPAEQQNDQISGGLIAKNQPTLPIDQENHAEPSQEAVQR